MAKQKQTLQLSRLSKGIITETNQLSQPIGSSQDELNMVLNNDETRSRRKGMGMESGGVIVPHTLKNPDLSDVAYSLFKWDLSDFYDGLNIAVVQTGDTVSLFTLDNGSLSDKLLASVEVGNSVDTKLFSFASVQDLLVIATGRDLVSLKVKTLEPFTLEQGSLSLEVRDLFGITDKVGDKFIDRGNGINYRPEEGESTDSHLYNLYNQGWPDEAVWCFLDKDGQDKFLREPVEFASSYLGKIIDGVAVKVFPSNGDNYNLYSVSDVNEAPASVDGFNPQVMRRGLELNAEAAKGRFIIDVFNRSQSRKDSTEVNLDIPVDSSPKQINAVAEFAGRVFYGGFSSKLEGGDDKSPRLGNYILFSQLINNSAQLGQCYQSANPTSKDDNELVATDGGFLRISGAVGINKLVSIGNSLMVFASNGVWQIVGGEDFGFSADNYQVVKVSERGCVSPSSAVNIGNQVMYWSLDGIYQTEVTEGGLASARNISSGAIKEIYDNIEDKSKSVGTFDEFNRTVRWLHSDNEELIYKVDFKAWTKFKVYGDKKLKGYIETPPFLAAQSSTSVVVEGEQVAAGGVDVAVTEVVFNDVLTETKYLYSQADGYSFSQYSDTDFKDWGEYDADAYIVPAYFTGGNGSSEKQSPYITFHFVKTETGFDSNYEPINSSSCLVQPRWDWANSANSNKFGREFQAYRFRRQYIPSNSLDEFNNGYETVVTKNKFRGKGKSLHMNIRTEPLKNLHLIGWEQEVTANNL